MFYLAFLLELALSETVQCEGGYGIDPVTDKCVICPNGEGILVTGYCGTCPSFEGIDNITKKCRSCPSGECINSNGTCAQASLYNAEVDPLSKICVCPNFQGFNSSGKCSKCYDYQCVDPYTKQCISREYNGINTTTGQCVKCKLNEKPDYHTHECGPCPEGADTSDQNFCNCPYGYGIDPVLNRCIICKDGDGILNNGRCGPCPKGQDASGYYGQCQSCDYGYGVDPKTKKCRQFEENEGLDPESYTIIQCPEGSTRNTNNHYCYCTDSSLGINSNNECVQCEFGEIISTSTGRCERCNDTQAVENNKCVDCTSGRYLDTTTRKCVSCEDVDTYCYDKDYKCVLIQDGQKKDSNGYCVCTEEGFGFDPDTMQCKKCPEGYLLDYNNICKPCPRDYYCIDPNTTECRYRNYDEGINAEDGYCKNCTEYGEAFSDSNARVCVKCKSDECINHEGVCQKMHDGIIADPKTNECTCPDFLGFNYTFEQCINCRINEGFDYYRKCNSVLYGECVDTETNYIRKINVSAGEGYNPDTMRCMKCPEDSTFHESRMQCVCNEIGKGIDPLTGQCVACKEGEGTGVYNSKCYNCSAESSGISTDGTCQSCRNNEGIDPETLQCGPCKEGEGILIDTGFCGKCPENQEIDESSSACKCVKGYVLDANNECYECPEGQIPYGFGCEKCSSYQCIKEDTLECININDEYPAKMPISGFCVTSCPTGASIYDYKCQCPTGQGFNSEFTACVECQEFEGVNERGQCEVCSENMCLRDSDKKCVLTSYSYFKDIDTGKCTDECSLGYNEYTRICGKCPEGSTMNYDGRCRCKAGEGIIGEENKCVQCPAKQGTDKKTFKCIDCEANQCISDGYCSNPSSSEGINETDKMCVYYSDIKVAGYGIDPATRIIRVPVEGECIDSYNDKKIRQIGEGEGIDEVTKMCKCPIFHIYNSSTNKCQACEIGECVSQYGQCFHGYANATTGKCEYSCGDGGYDPLTRICGVCAEGTSSGYSTSCKCPIQQGVLENEFKCGTCPENQGIDQETDRCRVCDPLEGIDYVSRKCIKCNNSIGYGIDHDTRVCVKCKDGQGINSRTLECGKCFDNEGISPVTGQCIPCTYPNVLDEYTNKCFCPDGQGYNDYGYCEVCPIGLDENTNKCKNCTAFGEGIDPDKGYCRKCNDDEGIDAKTLQCTKCPSGSSVAINLPYCFCQNKQGFDRKTKECRTCNAWEGIDNFTGECTICQGGFGIDPKTLRCRQLYNKEGIDQETGQILSSCPEFYGSDPNTKICIPCLEDNCIDRSSGQCMKPQSKQYINETTRLCTCSPPYGYQYSTYYHEKCDQCQYNQGIDPDTNACVFCEEGNCIDQESRHCRPFKEKETRDDNNLCTVCPDGEYITYEQRCGSTCSDIQEVDPNTNICTCPARKCFDRYNYKTCIDPSGDNAINPLDNTCKYCDHWKGFGIDPDTLICIKCNQLNPVTHECIVNCPEGSTRNAETNLCECTDNKGLDPNTNQCVTCPNRQGISPDSMFCIECPQGQGIDEETGKCTECKDGYAIDMSTLKTSFV